MVLSTPFSDPKLFLNMFSFRTIKGIIYPLIGLERDICYVDTINRKTNVYVNKNHNKHKLVQLTTLLHEVL